MRRKFLLIVVALVAVNAVARGMQTRGGLVAAMVAAWVIFGYITWRAWPAVCSDARRLLGLPSRNGGRGLRFRRSRRDGEGAGVF